MVKVDVGRQILWTPGTPTKASPSRKHASPSRKHAVDIGDGSAIGLKSDLLDGQDQVWETRSFDAPVESNVPNAVPFTQGQETNEIPQCGGDGTNTEDDRPDPLFSPSPSKKRKKNNVEASNQELKRKPKKKVYRPKIVIDESQKSKTKKKNTNKPNPKPKPKSKPKPNPEPNPEPMTPTKRTIPEPTTPKKSNNGIRKSPSCKVSLLSSFIDNGKASFSFLGDSNFEDEIGGFENSIGRQHNMLGNYETLTSLSSTCLIESRQVGPNFPIMCKRKRVKRVRHKLEKLLTPFKKGMRSKSFVRKKKCCVIFKVAGNSVTKKAMKDIVMKIRQMKKRMKLENAKHDSNDEIVVYNNQLVSYNGQHHKKMKVEVALDEETIKEWNLIMNAKKYEDSDDENKKRHWEEERYKYRCMFDVFMFKMHVVLGNRRFSPWNGSVLDSVVGAYLTQNVSDHLSSSAYMSLAATFPVKASNFELCNKDHSTSESHELAERNLITPIVELEDIEDFKVEETKEVQKVKEIEESPKVDQKEQDLDKERQEHWNSLREMYRRETRPCHHTDSVDWEAVRCAEVSKVAKAIEYRGQHNVIAGRIQALLNELNDSYGGLDLEWLRYIPPNDAKEYLLNIYGVGLKSVECIRLLTLQNQAFPVDVNVGRIAVRLGWVPLQPLPEETQIHNLEKFPLFNSIQKYLWPRLCTLDPDTLYQLHYHLITFGKVFCTKKNPNCNACPMKRGCRHFESARASANATASANVALPRTTLDKQPMDEKIVIENSLSTPFSEVNQSSTMENQTCEECEPIIEMPPSPEPESPQEEDEDHGNDEEEEEILTVNLSSQESSSEKKNDWTEKFKDDMNMNMPTKSLVAFADAENIPAPKMKNIGRLRTERLVYVLTDGHPLLEKCIPRDPKDPYPYLLAIWTPGELESSPESAKSSMLEEEDTLTLTVPGTLLIPCRTAMRGRFPLNGTYFQVNEVFADFDSMQKPIDVPRRWIWGLEKRVTYFGTGTSAIMRGLSAEQIHKCFWEGFVCVRAIEIKTGYPRPLSCRLHRNTMDKVRKANRKNAERE